SSNATLALRQRDELGIVRKVLGEALAVLEGQGCAPVPPADQGAAWSGGVVEHDVAKRADGAARGRDRDVVARELRDASGLRVARRAHSCATRRVAVARADLGD